MRVGFDIGGTFTDVIALSDDGRIETDKVLSLLDRVGEDVTLWGRTRAVKGSKASFMARPWPPTR